MGLFGPTKKGGGLDMRFKSNRGGYLGKGLRLGSELYHLSQSSRSSTREAPEKNPIKIWWIRKMNSRRIDLEINQQMQDAIKNNPEFLKEKEEMIQLSKTDLVRYFEDIDETIQNSFTYLRREGFANLPTNKNEYKTEKSLINSKKKTLVGYYVRTRSFKTYLNLVKDEIDRLKKEGNIDLSKQVAKKYKKAKMKAFFISGNFFLIVIIVIFLILLVASM